MLDQFLQIFKIFNILCVFLKILEELSQIWTWQEDGSWSGHLAMTE